jgi:hypothetical protein
MSPPLSVMPEMDRKMLKNPSGHGWVVQKFGGTSVGKFPDKIAEDIVRYEVPPLAREVSQVRKLTDGDQELCREQPGGGRMFSTQYRQEGHRNHEQVSSPPRPGTPTRAWPSPDLPMLCGVADNVRPRAGYWKCTRSCAR